MQKTLDKDKLDFMLLKIEHIQENDSGLKKIDSDLKIFFIESFSEIFSTSNIENTINTHDFNKVSKLISLFIDDIKFKNSTDILSHIINTPLFLSIIQKEAFPLTKIERHTLYKFINQEVNEEFKKSYYKIFVKNDNLLTWINSENDVSFISKYIDDSHELLYRLFYLIIDDYKKKKYLYLSDFHEMPSIKNTSVDYIILKGLLENLDSISLSLNELIDLVISPFFDDTPELFELIFEKTSKESITDSYQSALNATKDIHDNQFFITTSQYSIPYSYLKKIECKIEKYFNNKLGLLIKIEQNEFNNFCFDDFDISSQFFILQLSDERTRKKGHFKNIIDFIKIHNLYSRNKQYITFKDEHKEILKMNYKV